MNKKELGTSKDPYKYSIDFLDSSKITVDERIEKLRKTLKKPRTGENYNLNIYCMNDIYQNVSVEDIIKLIQFAKVRFRGIVFRWCNIKRIEIEDTDELKILFDSSIISEIVVKRSNIGIKLKRSVVDNLYEDTVSKVELLSTLQGTVINKTII